MKIPGSFKTMSKKRALNVVMGVQNWVKIG